MSSIGVALDVEHEQMGAHILDQQIGALLGGFVLEEAHNYLGSQSKGRAATAAKRIAKEGRKYGVGLMLVSQRPSEIDPTILSQCGTTISLRLTNDADQGQVRSCAADNLEGLFGMLPSLRTGEALLVGEAVSMPVRA